MEQKVDMFLSKTRKWQDEMSLLREIMLECQLKEDFKWMHPCYSYEGRNVVLIHGFKEYCALLFFKGVLIPDKKKLLIQQTENVQDRRQMRFTNVHEIVKLRSVIKAYVSEAVKIEKSGLKVEFKKTSEFRVPDEFRKQLESSMKLKAAFEKLTPGRQRGYLLYFSAAKQQQTRERRVEECKPKILAGKGLDD